jgi:hypothetical protein
MLLVVLGIFVGLFLVHITFVLLAVAFFSLKQVHPNTPTTNTKSNCCPDCGKTIAPEATFCANCDHKLN